VYDINFNEPEVDIPRQKKKGKKVIDMKQRLVPQPRQKKRLVALRSHHCQQETACCQDIKTQRICRENKNMYDKQYICC
jgi:hypothetical protein